MRERKGKRRKGTEVEGESRKMKKREKRGKERW